MQCGHVQLGLRPQGGMRNRTRAREKKGAWRITRSDDWTVGGFHLCMHATVGGVNSTPVCC